VNKSELIDAVAITAKITKVAAKVAVDAVLDNVALALASGDSVALLGFGTFSVKDRAARQGRNPATGAAMTIAAKRSAVFKAGKALNDQV
jgi:DNA-binding protein HU-beta